VPGPEVLGRVLLSDQALEVLVDLLGADVMPSAPFTVGEQLVPTAASALERGDHLDHGRVLNRLHPAYASLAQVIEHELGVVHCDALLEDRGQTDTAVVVRILLGTDTKQPDVKESDRAGEHPCLVELLSGSQRPQDMPAQAG